MAGRLGPFLKVILLGDSFVGKTSLVNRFVHKRFREKYKRTLFADISWKELQIDDRIVTLQLWDTPGWQRSRYPSQAYHRKADCCVLVYDVNVYRSFRSLHFWHSWFFQMVRPSDLNEIPFVVLGNKADTDGQDKRKVSADTAKQWCSVHGNIPYFETSTKENKNVDTAFLHVAKLALAHNDKLD